MLYICAFLKITRKWLRHDYGCELTFRNGSCVLTNLPSTAIAETIPGPGFVEGTLIPGAELFVSLAQVRLS
jgi:hypothetical protein